MTRMEMSSRQNEFGTKPVYSNKNSFLSCNRPFSELEDQTQLDEFMEKILADDKPKVSLTRREKEILDLVVAGFTNKKIAKEICRTQRTVEYHRNRLMSKLGAHTAADMVKRAVDFNLV